MKKIISIFLILSMVGCVMLTGCNDSKKESSNSSSKTSTNKGITKNDPISNLKATASNDKYRNYYQIFVNSFCDSNNDQTGDLQGIISQLDYLNDGDPNTGDDLGVDGIWLTPIMPSKSYHKYDVENYYDIDPNFGTLKDFDKLISECHKRGINVIIDLVLNHISSQNPLYLKAVEEVAKGKLDGNAEYFEIHKTSYFDDDTKYNVLENGYACEANFSPDMPEWNLNSAKTKKEFTKIAKFWLDRGVDGFRLDAVKYFTNKSTNGVEFLKWFYDMAKGIKSDVYMVGEDWDDDSEIEEFYKSGIDSLFAFKFSQSTGTFISNIIAQSGSSTVRKVKNYNSKMTKSNEDCINAYFLSNHDQLRSANALETKGLSYVKFAASVYMLAPGNPFIYYGEEIGIESPFTTSDSAFRTPMIFDSENLPDIFVNGVGDEAEAPKYGGVKQQLDDKNSILNFYRRVIKVKNQNPEIARGTITATQSFDDTQIGAYYVEYKGSKLLIIQNFSIDETKNIKITDDMIKNPEIRADLLTNDNDNHLTIDNGNIKLPAQSTVILKSSK